MFLKKRFHPIKTHYTTHSHHVLHGTWTNPFGQNMPIKMNHLPIQHGYNKHLKPFGTKKTYFLFAELTLCKKNRFRFSCLVVSTHSRNVSQIGSFPQIGMKIKICELPPPSKAFFYLFILSGHIWTFSNKVFLSSTHSAGKMCLETWG